MVSADSTVVDYYVPGPQGNRVPLLHLEALLVVILALGVTTFAILLGGRRGRSARSIGHVNVSHLVSVVRGCRTGGFVIAIAWSVRW